MPPSHTKLKEKQPGLPAPIILASSSTYRGQALEQLGLQFTAIAPDIDETALPGESIRDQVARLARAKTTRIATDFPTAIVIGGDQLGECNGNPLSKPGTSNAALEQLQAMSGRIITFYTAVAVNNPANGEISCQTVSTTLQMKALSERELRRYVALDDPIDCAGSFKIEKLGITLFSEVQSSDPSALVGLPLISLVDQLKICGVNVLR